MFIFSDLLTRLFLVLMFFQLLLLGDGGHHQSSQTEVTEDWIVLLSCSRTPCLPVCLSAAWLHLLHRHTFTHTSSDLCFVTTHSRRLPPPPPSSSSSLVVGDHLSLSVCVSIAPTETAAFCRTASVRVSTSGKSGEESSRRSLEKKPLSVILFFGCPPTQSHTALLLLFSSYSQCLWVIFKRGHLLKNYYSTAASLAFSLVDSAATISKQFSLHFKHQHHTHLHHHFSSFLLLPRYNTAADTAAAEQ